MRRASRQLSSKECYEILQIDKNADLQTLKKAYRRRAFELHPDLNPDNPEASRQFQLLNEAYVALSAVLKPSEETKENKEKADKTTKQSTKTDQDNKQSKKEKTEKQDNNFKQSAEQTSNQQTKKENQQTTTKTGYAEHDVLRDLLNDPFARRVFEDIYSELNKQQANQSKNQNQQYKKETTERVIPKEKQTTSLHKDNIAWGTEKWNPDFSKGVGGVVKDWLRRQIDDEQTITIAANRLAPGMRIRLQIRQGFSAESKSIEITLPTDFEIGKPIRLKGLGKKIGPWQGDLYLTIVQQNQ